MGSAAAEEPPPKPKEEATKEVGDAEPAAADVSVLHVYEDETKLRILVCGEADMLEAHKLKDMEVGLSSLIIAEVKAIRLLHRISAPPPPMAAAAHVRGVVTMRCDVCTTSGARIPLLVSGGGHTCFDDQLLEAAIRKELAAKTKLVRLVTIKDDSKAINTELRRSVAVAGGAPIIELRIATSAWAAQILRQLSSEVCYRRFAELGIAGVEGAPVAAFQKDDAARRCNSRLLGSAGSCQLGSKYAPAMPSWLSPPAPSRKRRKLIDTGNHFSNGGCTDEDGLSRGNREDSSGSSGNRLGKVAGREGSSLIFQKPPPLAAMKPVPHTKRKKLMPFAAAVIAGAQTGWSMKLPLPNGGTSRSRPSSGTALSGINVNGNTPATDSNQPTSGGMPPQFAFPVALVKPHGCSRRPMDKCAEEEFLQDVIQFLVSRGHGKLVPPGGPDNFPEAVLNGAKLDLYNLYKEVVSRGGFHVGNGINWKGQIFSKMRNHTTINKMTGVGNTLKKHYETYLLEYEFAHNDVDGECCILCHSGAAGDWVNCGVCGEWAHLGCDRRVGLAAFKDYAKTDGLEYICPHCSTSNGKVISRRTKTRSPLMAENPEMKEQVKARLMT